MTEEMSEKTSKETTLAAISEQIAVLNQTVMTRLSALEKKVDGLSALEKRVDVLNQTLVTGLSALEKKVDVLNQTLATGLVPLEKEIKTGFCELLSKLDDMQEMLDDMEEMTEFIRVGQNPYILNNKK